MPVNILTDFEQLAVYECRTKPSKIDKASFGRIRLYHYSEYVEKWDEIEATDHAIDTLVYQLYGLTDEEIKIVEGH